MTFEDAKDYINQHPEIYLKRAKRNIGGKPSYICPICGNGSGEDGTGIQARNGIHYHCFRCSPPLHEDIIGIIAREKGISNKEAIREAFSLYGLSVDMPEHPAPVKRKTPEAVKIEARSTEDIVQSRDRIIAASDKIKGGISYLNKRGISEATARRLQVGYDEGKRTIVLPCFRYEDLTPDYTERSTDDEKNRYRFTKGHKTGVFNSNALFRYEPMPCFITEGAFDALSIMEAGEQIHAAALNGAGNAEQFIRMVERERANITVTRFIIVPDNDEAGRKCGETLQKGLSALGFACKTVNISGEHKDANEALQAERDTFLSRVLLAAGDDKAAAMGDISAHSAEGYITDLKEFISGGAYNQPIATGFNFLDESIGGGLLPRLYCIGAITSLGKTTFALQIADYVASSGTPVLIFSLEMAKEDILARSISRHTYGLSLSHGRGTNTAKTELGILQGNRYKNYTEEERRIIEAAFAEYAEYAGNIFIYEGRRTVDNIRDIVKDFTRYTGKTPLVVIDYLQLLKPAEAVKKATQREQTDYAIDILASMRREQRTPIIAISAFNRANYTTVADGSAFKESGSIEYSVDCLITLSPEMKLSESKDNENKEAIMEAMRACPRKIRLTLLKNRGGKVGERIIFKYNPLFNHFEEDTEANIAYKA